MVLNEDVSFTLHIDLAVSLPHTNNMCSACHHAALLSSTAIIKRL